MFTLSQCFCKGKFCLVVCVDKLITQMNFRSAQWQKHCWFCLAQRVCSQVYASMNKKLVKVSCAKWASVFKFGWKSYLNVKWSEWWKRGFVFSQPLNKKLVKASCAKCVFTSLNVKLFDWSRWRTFPTGAVSEIPKRVGVNIQTGFQMVNRAVIIGGLLGIFPGYMS